MTGVCWSFPRSRNTRPCWMRTPANRIPTSGRRIPAAGRSRGGRRSTTIRRRKWAWRFTPTAAPRKVSQTKQLRAISSYQVNVLTNTYREKTPRSRSMERTTIRTMQTHSTEFDKIRFSMGLPRRLHGRHEPTHVLLPHLRCNHVIHGPHSIQERLQGLHFVDLHPGLLDDQKVGLLFLNLGRSVSGARRPEALVHRLPEFGRQGLVLLEVHEPSNGGVGAPA